MNGAPVSRPLAELSPMERRRNSPSYNQTSRKALFNGDSSPFDSSPLASNSPRQYWQSRDPSSPTRFSMENRNPFEVRESSPSAAKRSSIENLKRASRVKNSNMFEREQKQVYDPTSTPVIERPLASGRSLNVHSNGNTPAARASDIFRKETVQEIAKIPIYNPLKSPAKFDVPQMQKSHGQGQSSPGKSSLSKNSRYAQAFDLENSMWSEEEESIIDRQLPPGKSLHRHAKSVTFDAAPPEVNEYEMQTPDPSSVASGSREGSCDSGDGDEDESFDRASLDRDDSFDASLEDTDKTPVVLPEDWRFMSPAVAHDDLAKHMEDPFEGDKMSPPPTAQPTTSDSRLSPTRTDSLNSNGSERRPLPPLPALGMPLFPRVRSDSNSSLLATAERIGSAQRTLPSLPRPASMSKSELQGIGGSSMPIEDRLRLMMLQETEKNKNPAEEQRERRLRRGRSPGQGDDSGLGIKIHEDKVENDEVADLAEYQLPPRISRESILRKVKSRTQLLPEDDYDDCSPAPSSSPDRQDSNHVDPDIPLPSLEDTFNALEIEESIIIKQEEDAESEVDVYSIPEMYRHNPDIGSPSEINRDLPTFSVPDTYFPTQKDDDEESQYSTDANGQHQPQAEQSNSATEDEGPPTPRPQSPQSPQRFYDANENNSKSSHRMSLPQFASMLGEDDFGLGLQSYLTPTPPLDEEPIKADQRAPLQNLQEQKRPVTPEEQLYPPTFPGYGDEEEDEPRTPDSVIRHSVIRPGLSDSPEIPEPSATIKAPGGGLKTRASIAPADARAMAETRRQVSGEKPMISTIPEFNKHRLSTALEEDSLSTASSGDTSSEGGPVKQIKRKSSLVQLEVPLEEIDEGLSIGLDREFDRVIEAQKVAFSSFITTSDPDYNSKRSTQDYIRRQRSLFMNQNFANISTRPQKGYLMRQNTKMVVASSASHDSNVDPTDAPEAHIRGTRSAGNSPRKPSHTQTWTTEPWNGKIRRKSIRQSAGSPQKRVPNGTMPPLPGQQSNVTSGLDSVNENEAMPDADMVEDGEERGRLFVKVVGVKELDLPLPKNERSYFALTLDNGLHCVTTAWLELGKFAPIGQEFELVVLNELEFQLTLQTKLEEPKPKPPPPSPTKTVKPQKPSTFSRVFASPRKRKELELKQQEEAQRAAKQKQLDAQASKKAAEPCAWDLLHNLVAKDGSFARSYICLKDHESQAYGKPFIVDVPCFNEWAMEEVQTMGSARSGWRSTATAMQRKAPYKIGKLELQLLFVPKPKGAQDGDMPKSMNACIRELQEAEITTEKSWEGNLSQQGGDCPYWRRRFFRLEGSKLTAYHEATRQPRATINLAKASKLIDDKSSLIQKEVSGKGGSRRRSAFAAEEEGYMFVEEGFRIRFANGETIDFYADSAAEKEDWMKVLVDVVGKEAKTTKKWTDLVLAKQRSTAQRASRLEPGLSSRKPSNGMRSAPPTPGPRQGSQPAKRPSSTGIPPPPVEKDSRHQADHRRHQKTRSMVY
ncbi:Bud site selection protein bud4 [Xylographa trunciseda]|nr:Bud site selection protein bud4 [Xylographa trunciseda]